MSLGAVVRQEQAQSAALAPIVEEARTSVQQADMVNMDETGWRQAQQRASLWTVVTAELTVFRIDRCELRRELRLAAARLRHQGTVIRGCITQCGYAV